LIEEFDHAIFQALIETGTLTYNNLYRATQKVKTCSPKTFDKHLNTLVQQEIIVRTHVKGKSQAIEYSINPLRKNSQYRFLEIIEKWGNSGKEIQDDADSMIKKYHKLLLMDKRDAEVKKLRKILLKNFSRTTVLLTKESQIELFLRLCGNKLIANKATQIHKRRIEQFQKSLKELRKIDDDSYKNVMAQTALRMNVAIPGITS